MNINSIGGSKNIAEAAWLLKQNKNLTLEEKHKAWTEIISCLLSERLSK